MHSQVFPHAHFGRWPQLLSGFTWRFVYLLVEASASVLDPCMWNFFHVLRWSGHECVASGLRIFKVT